MADLIVSILKSYVIPLVQEQLKQMGKVDEKIEELKTKFGDAQRVLNHAEEISQQNEDVKKWLANLKDVSYETDDVLDLWRTENLRRKDREQDQEFRCFSFVQNNIWSPVSANACIRCFCLFIEKSILEKMSLSFPWGECCFRVSISHEIEEIERKLDGVLKRKEELGLQPDQITKNSKFNISNNDDSDGEEEEEAFIGREKDKGKIIDMLKEMDSGSSIISITGISGVGKTKLARQVCKDEKVKNHFDTIIWMDVPTPFDPDKLAQKTSIIKPSAAAKSWDDLKNKFFDKKLVLLVLDDPRDNYTCPPWSQLKDKFQKANDGSKVLVTSQSKNFASDMRWSRYKEYPLQGLSEQDCRRLFDVIAFRWENDLTEKVKYIGHQIADKCDRLPQAIKAVAKLLTSMETERDWQGVLDSNIWQSKEFEGVYRPLRCCYSELDPPLKACFAYFALFIKAEKISKYQLVRLWMAQGLVPYSSRYRNLEAVGDTFVSKLEKLSLFQDVERAEDGEIISFSMHHSTVEFARQITNGEFDSKKIEDFYSFPQDHGDPLRHLTLVCCGEESKVADLQKLGGLRTLRVQPIGRSSKLNTALVADIFSRLTRLRALDLSKCDIGRGLPDEVKELTHLRYLNLSQTKLQKLPKTVCTLYNLQTLGLNECEELEELPQQMGDMKNLRHLEIFGTEKLRSLPQGIRRLTSLWTLSKFIVRGHDASIIQGLGALGSLHGCLEIRIFLEEVANLLDENLGKNAKMQKKHLRELRLKFECCNGPTADEKRLEGFIKGLLQLPKSLSKLEIRGYPGTSFPNFIRTEDAAIKVLKLYDFPKCKKLSTIGKLEHLEEVQIAKMPKLENIDDRFFNSMPKLRSLTLQECEKLEGQLLCHLQSGKLKELNINNCPALKWPISSPLNLSALQDLFLSGDADVLISQTQIKLPELKYLHIDCSGSGELPRGLGQFEKLQTLEISWCHEIDSLPNDLPKLEELRVNDCKKLGPRCQKDWDKIPGISNIIIDYKKMERVRNPKPKNVSKHKPISSSKIPEWSRLAPPNQLQGQRFH